MEALFTLAGSIAVLVLLSIASSSGIAFLSLSSTPYSRSIPVVSITFLPLALVVGLSSLGHISANEISISAGKYFILIGITISIFVIFKSWQDIVKVFLTRTMAFSTASGLASLGLFLYLNSTEPFAYNYLGNGEFLNYARLASVMLDSETALPAFFEHHRSLRFGQDIFLAVLAKLFNKNPIELVHIASGYLMFAYGSTIGLVIAKTFGENRHSALLLLIHGLMLTVLFNFNASFFSSTVTLSAAILILAYAVSNTDSGSSMVDPKIRYKFFLRMLGTIFLLIISIVFFAITYPEFGIPVFGAAVGLASLQSIRLRRLSKPLFSLSIAIVSAFLLAFPAFVGALKGFYGQLAGAGGWNIFGNPQLDLSRFLLSISGLSYPFTTNHISDDNFVNYGVLICVIIAAGAGVQLGLKKSNPAITSSLALWLTISAVVLFSPLITGRNWYPAAKYFSQFSIGSILLIGFAVGIRKHNLVSHQKLLSLRMLLLFGLFLSVSTFEVISAKPKIEVLNFGKWFGALKGLDKNLPLTVFRDREGEVLWFAEIAAKAAEIALLPISTNQINRLARQASSMSPPHCLAKELPINHDLSSFPHSTREIFAVVGAQDAKVGVLRSDQGFDVAVLSQATVASLGTLRIDRVSLGTTTDFSFGQDSWAVDGIWAACVIPRNDYISVAIDVPAPLISSVPLDLIMHVGNDLRHFKILTSGRHILFMKVPPEAGLPALVILKTSTQWIPKNSDSTSTDTRRLGVKVVALSV